MEDVRKEDWFVEFETFETGRSEPLVLDLDLTILDDPPPPAAPKVVRPPKPQPLPGLVGYRKVVEIPGIGPVSSEVIEDLFRFLS